MSVISKSVAEQVSNQLVSKKQKALTEKKGVFKKSVTEAYKKSLSKTILDLFKKEPEFFKTTSSLSILGNGWNWETVELSESLPAKDKSYRSIFQPDSETADILRKEYNEIETESNKLKKLFQETEQALLSLKTYKRVEENFPEAFPFLPMKKDSALVVNLSDLRNKLK